MPRRFHLYAPIWVLLSILVGCSSVSQSRERMPVAESGPPGNSDVINSWRAWVLANGAVAADTFPSDSESVAEWFERSPSRADRHLRCFATTGDGGLLAIWSQDGTRFERGPIVFLSSEGDVHVLAESALDAFALLAAIGNGRLADVIEGRDSAEAHEGYVRWLKENYLTPAKKDPAAYVAKATAKNHSIVSFVSRLNG